MTFRDRIQHLSSSRIVRSVLVLVGGTAFAHAITAAALPIVTRLYTPADFGILAVFASLLSMASVAACLRFDLAIAIPEHENEATDVLALALLCAAATSLFLTAAVLLAPAGLSIALNQPGLAEWLWLLPPGVLLAGGYSALQMWFVRKKEFLPIARSRVAQSTAAAATQIGMGLLHLSPIGLILGQLLNAGVGCISLGQRLLRHDGHALRDVTVVRLRNTFAKYKRFPKYSTFEALCNAASIQLPIVVIAALAYGPEAGYLILAMTAMQIPMGLVGTAVSQVYLSRAPEELRQGRLDAFTTEVFGGLARSGVGPLTFVGVIAPALFPIIFGPAWQRAGLLVSWMTPWFIMQFLSVPVSMALHVTGHQRAALFLQIFGLASRLGIVYAVWTFRADWISEGYALSGFIFYLVYLVVVLRVVSARTGGVLEETIRAMPIIAGWAVAGCIVAVLTGKLHAIAI